ncbi:hypothetical protein [Streptomyces cellostaticus]|uniref:hypothetical protein n=1 Tax=Streptomyces cellostaticus TaxID=67285 RepID=UPI002026B9CF|nr:hypothetical protein [Streptomyces cellostaticus]
MIVEADTKAPRRSIVTLEFGNEVPPRSFAGLIPAHRAEDRLVIDPLAFPGMGRRVVRIAEQAQFWADRINRTVARPQAVLAYCSAASLAEHIVAALKRSDVRLILFDPEYPDRQAPMSLFRELADSSGGTGATEQIPDLTGLPADELLRQAGAFLVELLERNAPDLDRTIAEELTTGQRAWLSFVLATSPAPIGVCRPDHVFLSDSSTWRASRDAAVHHIGGPPTELFRSPSVTTELSEILGAGATCN